MDPPEILARHLTLCEEVHGLLMEENSWLKSKQAPPEEALLERKRALLPRLDESLDNLKRLRPEFFSPFDDSKELVTNAHSRLLQIFYLDRENEDLLLKICQPSDRATFNRFADPEEIDDFHGRGGEEPSPPAAPS